MSFALPPKLLGAAAVSAFRGEALSLADDLIEGFNVDPAVMMVNVRTGIESVQPRLAEIVEARPKTNVAWIVSLPNLGRAVEHAAANTAAAPAVTRAQIAAKYAELQRYRMPALLVAKALASDLFKLLPAEQVAALEEGQGLYDHGQDAISLASLLRTHAAAIADLHPFTPEHLATMESLGSWVCEAVTPGGARAKKRAVAGSPADLRDRLWTLLKRRYAELRRAGIELFGEDEVDAYVPRLNSHARTTAPSADNDNGGDTPPAPPAPPTA